MSTPFFKIFFAAETLGIYDDGVLLKRRDPMETLTEKFFQK
jgi:hypothetical protein